MSGHRFVEEDGVRVLLSDDFARRLRAYLEAHTAFRATQGRRILDPSIYPDLPFSLAGDDFEWRMRVYDLAVVQRLLSGSPQPFAGHSRRMRLGSENFGRVASFDSAALRSGCSRELRILEIGAYNGWLGHRLTALGHCVTAVDYFVDEYDGLRAMKFYPVAWRAIQMDLRDLSALDETFDAVILNRCLQFFPDPIGYVAAARQRVAPGGLLIITGLQFYRDIRARLRQVAAIRARLGEFGLDFIHPTRGSLDFEDRRRLAGQGMILKPYPQLWRANLKAWLRPTLPRHEYGVNFDKS